VSTIFPTQQYQPLFNESSINLKLKRFQLTHHKYSFQTNLLTILPTAIGTRYNEAGHLVIMFSNETLTNHLKNQIRHKF
jgi:hypothetical protein